MTKIIQRHDTAANWTSVNPTLSQGEFGIETDTGKFKIGDGQTAWNSLAYASSGGGGETDAYTKAETDNLLDKKQDKLNAKSPLKIDTVAGAQMVGFSVDSSTGLMRADSNQPEVMLFGYARNNTITTSNVQSYIKIPYTIGQVIRLPFKPTSQYSTSYTNKGTAMIAGWYGHTEDDGSVTPIFTCNVRANESGSSYDTSTSYGYYNFANDGTGLWTANSSFNGAHFPGTVAGSSDMPVLYTQVTIDTNDAKTIFDIQFPSNGYNNPDYTKYWTDGLDPLSTDILNSIDCFIYCPPAQEYIDQKLFGLFNVSGRLGPGMLETITNGKPKNLFSLESADIKYLQLNIGDGLSVVDGKLTATSSSGTPENMVTTDTEQEITGSKLFSNGLKVGGYAGISDNNGEQFICVDTSHNGWTIGTQNSGGWFSDVHIKRGASGDYINIDSGNISDYVSGIEEQLANKQDKCIHIIDTYQNGSSGYRIWSDGYCEQWGAVAGTGSEQRISLLKTYKSLDYNIQVTIISTSRDTSSYRAISIYNVIDTSTFSYYGSSNMYWRTCGYLT